MIRAKGFGVRLRGRTGARPGAVWDLRERAWRPVWWAVLVGGRLLGMAEEIDRRAAFYYNINTKQVERWGQSPETDLLGPFGTAEDAANALEIIRSREARKEAEDQNWSEGPAR